MKRSCRSCSREEADVEHTFDMLTFTERVSGLCARQREAGVQKMHKNKSSLLNHRLNVKSLVKTSHFPFIRVIVREALEHFAPVLFNKPVTVASGVNSHWLTPTCSGPARASRTSGAKFAAMFDMELSPEPFVALFGVSRHTAPNFHSTNAGLHISRSPTPHFVYTETRSPLFRQSWLKEVLSHIKLEKIRCSLPVKSSRKLAALH